MATCSITDDIIIDNPEAVERLIELLEEGDVKDDQLRKDNTEC